MACFSSSFAIGPCHRDAKPFSCYKDQFEPLARPLTASSVLLPPGICRQAWLQFKASLTTWPEPCQSMVSYPTARIPHARPMRENQKLGCVRCTQSLKGTSGPLASNAMCVWAQEGRRLEGQTSRLHHAHWWHPTRRVTN